MPANIVDLLPEVIEAIFDYLPKANDRRRLSQVCKTFYKIIRGQSKHFGTLYIGTPEKSPLPVFKNSTSFPFSELFVKAPDDMQNRDFWLERGQCISKLTINCRFSFDWIALFPCLKILSLCELSKLMIDENAPKIQLPLEKLYIESGLKMDGICYILQCCPLLKSFEFSLGSGLSKRHAKLFPLIESIETVKVIVQRGVPLKQILELPSKVLIQELCIPAHSVTPESLASFFNKPRRIENIYVIIYPGLPENFLFTKDKILPMLKAESIENLILDNNVPDFPGSLDLLAEVPGLQEFEISFYSRERTFLHRYWSSPNTASKIHKIEFGIGFCPGDLTGLTSLTSLVIKACDGLEVLRNHPKMKELVIERFTSSDAQLEPISSLYDLEILKLEDTHITSAAFKTIFKFPKLKKFAIRSGEMKNDVAMLLPENCPNLEEVELGYAQSLAYFRAQVRANMLRLGWSTGDIEPEEEANQEDSLNDAGFEHLIRALPYLKKIKIGGERHTVSQEKVQQMQMEFPYLKIDVKK